MLTHYSHTAVVKKKLRSEKPVLPGSFFISIEEEGLSFLKDMDDDGFSGMKAATMSAMITSTAPKANGGPGTRF